jgi:hypothetical protein
LIVRGPNKRLLLPQGEHVPEITFWHRRVRDGDVVLAEASAPPPPQPRPPAAVALIPPVIDKAAASATADAFEWHLPPAASQLKRFAGELLQPTAAELARLPALGSPSGPAVEGYAVAEGEPERDPAPPIHDIQAESKP